MAIAARLPSVSNATFRVPHKALGVALMTNRARALGRPVVMEMLTPAAVAARGLGEETKEPNAWDNTNKAIAALSTTVGAGTKFYLERQQVQQATAAADAAQRQAEAARRAAQLQEQADAEARRAALLAAANAPQGMPAWVLPASIAAVAIFGIGTMYFMKKKKA